MPPVRLRPAMATAARCASSRTTCRQFSVSACASSSSRTPVDRLPGSEAVDVAKLLEHPTWSVASLLSESRKAPEESSEVTLAQLRHLLRLSALPFPASAEEQAAKLDTLRTQLHFVRDIQSVDTTGLQPLQAIRDETREGLLEQTIGVKEVEQALLQEEAFGHNRRPQRRKRKVDVAGTEDWDALATASRKAGRYIVVNGAEQ